ncbi:MAG TPA: hypothetical protein VIF62_27705 [Labilithrix sp.]
MTEGLLGTEKLSYRGKHYEVPLFDPADPVVIVPRKNDVAIPRDEPVIRTLDTTWDLAQFTVPRKPISLGLVEGEELAEFARPGAVRLLDMPIKFPDVAEYRLPRALRQFARTLQRIVDFEHAVNAQHAEYYAYLTIDQRWVEPGTLMREAPCHVDGFQGARWKPKCRTNHTYTVSDVLPTAYYVQPFDFAGLDEAKHDFYWEMNAQVADTNEAHRWQPRPAELTLMDCYCVHRGVENDTPARMFRTWLRLSFEERRRVFDRLGNAHNPCFDYAWEMVERDIEMLKLVAFRADCDPTLRVFPWQDAGGDALPRGAPKTKPRLRK